MKHFLHRLFMVGLRADIGCASVARVMQNALDDHYTGFSPGITGKRRACFNSTLGF